MKHLNHLMLILFSLLWPFHNAKGLEVVENPALLTEPQVTVSEDTSGITVEYAFNTVLKIADPNIPEAWSFAIPGFTVTTKIGNPAILQRWDTFTIPEGFDAQVSLESVSYQEFGMQVAPARKLLTDELELVGKNPIIPIKSYEGWKPAEAVEMEGLQVYRDRNLLSVCVRPVSYNLSEEMVRIAENMQYKISFIPTRNAAKSREASVEHVVDADVMSGMLTFPMTDKSTMNRVALPPAPKWEESEWYLVITLPKYIKAVESFVDWKRKMGYNVKVKGKDRWTTAEVFSAIKEEYDSNPLLEYVMIIGSGVEVPPMVFDKIYPDEYIDENDNFSCISDYLYGCMDGDNDYTADLSIGRLSVTTLDEAINVVNKIKNYERNKKLTDRVLHCAEFSDLENKYGEEKADGFEDRRFTRTSEDIAVGATAQGYNVERVYNYNRHYSGIINSNKYLKIRASNWNNTHFGYGEPIPAHLSDSTFNWDGDTQDVISAFSQGANYVFHRGHGSVEEWVHPNFKISDVASLRNSIMTPVVFNINCATGTFPTQLRDPECLAEALLRKSMGGAVGVVAATADTYSGCNDVMIMELFQALWPMANVRYSFPLYTPLSRDTRATPIRQMGKLLNMAKVRLGESYSLDDAYNKFTRVVFHWFGDPGMEIQEYRKFSPKVMHEVTMPSSTAIIHTLKTISPTPISWIRVDNGTGIVSRYTNSSMSFLDSDLTRYSYYMISACVPPTEVTSYISYTVRADSEIQAIGITENMMRVKYAINEAGTSKIVVRNIITGNMLDVDVPASEEYVDISMDSQNKGMYSVSLYVNGLNTDTKKVLF